MNASGLSMLGRAWAMRRKCALLAVAGFAAWAGTGSIALAKAPSCPIDANDRSICDVPRPEDMVPLQRSEWVIVSSYSPDALYRVSTRTRQAVNLVPDARAQWNRRVFPTCPGALPTGGLTAHGLALADGAKPLLFVINHGSREAIEVYQVRKRDAALTWVGCLPLPDDMMANSLVRLRSGDLVVTSLGKHGTNPLPGIIAGSPTGDVRLWSKAAGWSRLAGSEGSGPNGLALSADQRSVYVAMSGSREVVQMWLDGKTPPRRSIQLNILPDNLRWTMRGTLITTGMRYDPEKNARCFGDKDCLPPFDVYEITPGSLAVESLSDRIPFRSLPLTTTALEVGNDLWISGVGGQSITVLPLKPR